MGDPPRAHQAVQVLTRDLRPGGLDRGDDVRLANVPAGPTAHVLPGNRIAGRGQPSHGLDFLRFPSLARHFQAFSQPGIVDAERVAQQVHFDQAARWVILNGQLDTRNDLKAVTIERSHGVQTRERVVVGDGDGRKPGGRVGPDHLVGC